jgi:hypothetical protein
MQKNAQRVGGLTLEWSKISTSSTTSVISDTTFDIRKSTSEMRSSSSLSSSEKIEP